MKSWKVGQCIGVRWYKTWIKWGFAFCIFLRKEKLSTIQGGCFLLCTDCILAKSETGGRISVATLLLSPQGVDLPQVSQAGLAWETENPKGKQWYFDLNVIRGALKLDFWKKLGVCPNFVFQKSNLESCRFWFAGWEVSRSEPGAPRVKHQVGLQVKFNLIWTRARFRFCSVV